MDKWIKILVIIISTPVILFVILVCIYIIMNWQKVIDPYFVGNPDAPNKVLIASQGSEFKNRLLEELIQQLKNENIYLSIIDCTSLKEEDISGWNAVVIIHTTKAHKIPQYVKTYLNRFPSLSKVVLVSTSGGGDEVVTEYDIDAISTASRLEDTEKIANLTITKVKDILPNQIN